jgi:hypothetical protein
VVRYAFELDPDVRAVNKKKQTAMHAAVDDTLQRSTQPEICKVIQFLADKGAELDPADEVGSTPLMIADGPPIDTAVELLTKLITATGAKPRRASRR